jgi:hypothetical protein
MPPRQIPQKNTSAPAEADAPPVLEKPLPDKANGAKIPIAFQLRDQVIDGAVIKPLTFQAFAECVGEAHGMRAPKAFEARLRRLRMVRQVTYYTNGSTAAVTIEDVAQMPIPTARTITARLDDSDEGVPGKIVRPGDGIDRAIVYALGAPIPMGQGKESVTELEFLAKTYGEIEDILAAPDSIQQAALLLSSIATPLGTTLTRLPSWALAQVSVADGVTIAKEVLPHFLGSADDSLNE